MKEYTSKTPNDKLEPKGLVGVSSKMHNAAEAEANSIAVKGVSGFFKSALGTVSSMALNMGTAMLVSKGMSLLINLVSNWANKWDNASSAGAEARKK